ncbi:DUF3987 domain-containing protein [Chryseobacterium sp. NEB161]|nr:DUF3987 domain-containing protein [Chryseobacterium sp. NEB161]
MSNKINPKFEDLRNPEIIQQHINELTKVCASGFPVEVFPEAIQEVIKATNETLLYPIDFIGSAILYAISVATGNTHTVEVKKGWRETCAIYISIVGRPGTSKTHPISYALKPIHNTDSENFKEYQLKYKQYDKIKKLSQKERDAKGIDEPDKPIWKQHLVSDFTPEALTDTHKVNLRGIGVYVDELASWFNNFNRYNNGSEEQFWLSVWSGATIRINRKTSEPTFIQKPFISVMGTIQPGVLNELANNRKDNGFLDRLLFVVPDNLKKEYWNDKELEDRITDNWDAIISKLTQIKVLQTENGSVQPDVLTFTHESKRILSDYQRTLTDRSNSAPDAEAAIYAKIEVYAIRLALILEMSFYACDESNKKNIGTKAVEGAIKLCEFFLENAFNVHSILNGNSNKYENLPQIKQDVYDNLPDIFTTQEGWQIAEKFGMKERTYQRFIKEKELFNEVKHGEYSKKL